VKWAGFKSKLKSVDLEFRRDDTYYIVGIKSGVYWGNADQINAMKRNFKAAKETLRQELGQEPIVAVNGCIYGFDRQPLKRDDDPDKVYYKYAGQHFWEFISGNPTLYRDIILPIDQQAKQKDSTFKTAYAAKINEITQDFISDFVTDNLIDWAKLIDFVSQRRT
jgi:site-specific DNA-methyltransferase (cytosine-N4-specific)